MKARGAEHLALIVAAIECLRESFNSQWAIGSWKVLVNLSSTISTIPHAYKRQRHGLVVRVSKPERFGECAEV